jgi:alpha-D-ribose 1-methylphosphonate 5-triphosphate synthase subunit PhnH
VEEYLVTQAIYRDLLTVMSRPGTVRKLTEEISEISPHGLVAVAATLLDQEVSFAVLDDDELSIALRRKTDARPVEVAEANFVFVVSGSSGGQIADAQRGTHRYPDKGATILYQVEHLAEQNSESTVDLTGPGIADVNSPLIRGFDIGELELLVTINQDYPLGIDLIFLDRDNRVMALPRSTHITINDQ